MDILESVAIEMPCQACGGRYEVPLRQILLSDKMLHDGCPVQTVEECPPLSYSSLVNEETIKELQRVWARLEEQARGAGGELKLRLGSSLATGGSRP
jgi:hypothetical protein